MRLATLLASARKELLLFLGDRKALVVTLVTPIAIAAFFGFIFSDHGEGQQSRLAVCAADEDQSALSKEILRGLAADKALEVQAATAPEAKERVRKGKAVVGLVLPKGFGDAAAKALFGSGAKPEIQFLYDPSRGAELSMVRGILTQYAMEAVSREVFTGDQGRTVVDDSLARLEGHTGLKPGDRDALRTLLRGLRGWQDRQSAAKAQGEALPSAGFTVPYGVREEAVTGKEGQAYNGYAHSFAGMGIQFVLFAAVELGVGILMERRMGLWKRLRAAPVSRGEVVMGKALGGAIIAAITLGVTLGAGMAFFGIRVNGSWLGLFALVFASCCMSAAFGLLLAALGGTPQATRGMAIFAVLLLTMLGGGWVPAFVFPRWMQTLTLAVPTRWAMDGLDAVIWRGGDLGAALLPAAVLLGFTVLFGAVAILRFPWQESD